MKKILIIEEKTKNKIAYIQINEDDLFYNSLGFEYKELIESILQTAIDDGILKENTFYIYHECDGNENLKDLIKL